MPFVTAKPTPQYRQMIMFDDMFRDLDDVTVPTDEGRRYHPATTRTVFREFISFPGMADMLDGYVQALHNFNEMWQPKFEGDLHNQYYSFKIPKRSGGWRTINAPNDDLKEAQRVLAGIFENVFGALYHTSAYAYVKKRSTIDAVRKHQANASRWFLKLDFHDFFGSTTPDFVMHMFSMIWPFSGIMQRPGGREELALALSLCFLDGGLPQGTPISPMLTNIMMIPIDHDLCNGFLKFRDGGKDLHMVYTRYADDLLISCKIGFDQEKAINFVKSVLAVYNAPMSLNDSKTRYASSSGRNWNLGVMLNKDNEITIGHKNKELLRSMLHHYISDRQSGSGWELSDIQALAGKISYFRMVEPNAVDHIIDSYNQKFNVNIMASIKQDITP